MTTQRAFELIHKPENEYVIDKERRSWVEATWSLKREQLKQLKGLCK